MHTSLPRVDQLFSILLCGCLLLLQGGLNPSIVELSSAEVSEYQLHHSELMPVIRIEADPIEIQNDSLAQISATSFLVFELNSGSILLSRNPFQPLYPASTVKLMTALVALEEYAPTSFLAANPSLEVVGNTVGLKAGSWMSVADLLKATLINSGNDAALVLANNCEGGYDQFINKMNQKAIQLSMHQTRFINPTGLDDPAQLCSSWDLSLLARAVLNQPQLVSIVSTKRATVVEYPSRREIFLLNTNLLLNPADSVNGMKTGTTELAKQVLITSWSWQEHPVLIVVMGSDDRYQDTQLLMKWVQDSVWWSN